MRRVRLAGPGHGEPRGLDGLAGAETGACVGTGSGRRGRIRARLTVGRHRIDA